MNRPPNPRLWLAQPVLRIVSLLPNPSIHESVYLMSFRSSQKNWYFLMFLLHFQGSRHQAVISHPDPTDPSKTLCLLTGGHQPKGHRMPRVTNVALHVCFLSLFSQLSPWRICLSNADSCRAHLRGGKCTPKGKLVHFPSGTVAKGTDPPSLPLGICPWQTYFEWKFSPYNFE